MPKHSRLRNFCFTWNNYDANTLPYLKPILNTITTYYVIGEEKGEKKETPHLQGYVELKGQKSFRQIKNILQNNHFERRRGTARQAVEYCKKEGRFQEHGSISEQGERTDITTLRDAITSGMDDADLVQIDELQGVIARHPKYIGFVRRSMVPRRAWRTRLHVYWGDTGTGKSHKAAERTGDRAYYKDNTSPLYWDNYLGNDEVIIEDFRGEIPLAQMLRLVDKYPMQVQVKGSWMNFAAKDIYITSNLHPRDWWNSSQKGYEASYKAFEDRITTIEHFSGQSRRNA